MTVLNIRAETIRLLEESIGINLHNLGFGSCFLENTPKRQSAKENKFYLIKIKNLHFSRHQQKSEKKTHRLGGNISKSHTDRVSGVYKEFLKLNNKSVI